MEKRSGLSNNNLVKAKGLGATNENIEPTLGSHTANSNKSQGASATLGRAKTAKNSNETTSSIVDFGVEHVRPEGYGKFSFLELEQKLKRSEERVVEAEKSLRMTEIAVARLRSKLQEFEQKLKFERLAYENKLRDKDEESEKKLASEQAKHEKEQEELTGENEALIWLLCFGKEENLHQIANTREAVLFNLDSPHRISYDETVGEGSHAAWNGGVDVGAVCFSVLSVVTLAFLLLGQKK